MKGAFTSGQLQDTTQGECASASACIIQIEAIYTQRQVILHVNQQLCWCNSGHQYMQCCYWIICGEYSKGCDRSLCCNCGQRPNNVNLYQLAGVQDWCCRMCFQALRDMTRNETLTIMRQAAAHTASWIFIKLLWCFLSMPRNGQ